VDDNSKIISKGRHVSDTTIERTKVEPGFDLMYYMNVHGTKRIEHAVLEKAEVLWNDWKDRVHAYRLAQEDEEARDGVSEYLLVHLPQSVEDQVEEIWQEDPKLGLAMHNLAITLVMSAAQSVVPELSAGACAPLPRPDKSMRNAFKKLGLRWNIEGNVGRQYAVLTNVPYKGGCDLCYLKDSCMESTVRQG
jgi:hypothetical protein